MKRALVLLLTFSGPWGCTWENTVHTSANAPSHLRLTDHFRVVDRPRFRIDPAASMTVISATEQAKLSWLTAANRGIHEIYPNASSERDYLLRVVWPEPSQAHEPTSSRRVDAGLLGFYEVPRVSAQRTLVVHLTSPSGQPIHTMKLVLAPQLWGKDWNDESVLQQGFAQLARSLRGG